MANPSLKNGYISVANELVEKFATLSIPSSEMRIVWVVWRKTWGWTDGERKKDWDWISLSQFEKLTTIKHGNVVKLLKSLVYKRILLKGKNGYKFNQNYDEWVVCKRIPPVCKRIQGSMQTHTKSSMQTHTYKRNKETNTKDNMQKLATNVADDVVFVPVQEKKPRKDYRKYDDETPFTLEEFVATMEASPKRHVKIVGMYADTKRIKNETKGQWRLFTDRNIAPARRLSVYSDEQIAQAFTEIEKNMKGPGNKKGYITRWTLETIEKYLEEI